MCRYKEIRTENYYIDYVKIIIYYFHSINGTLVTQLHYITFVTYVTA